MPVDLRKMLAAWSGPDTPLGARDRAMLLLGLGAALRRWELVTLTLEVAVYVLNHILDFGRPS
jgi:site-specific recombinase XerC